MTKQPTTHSGQSELSGEMAQKDVIQRLQSKLRNLFDSYLSDESVEACIEVAVQLGWNELAYEMQGDLMFEKEKI